MDGMVGEVSVRPLEGPLVLVTVNRLSPVLWLAALGVYSLGACRGTLQGLVPARRWVMAGPFSPDDTVVTRGETDAHGTLRTVAHFSGPFLCRRPCRG